MTNAGTEEEVGRLNESSPSRGKIADGSNARNSDLENKLKKLQDRIERQDKDIINLKNKEVSDKTTINSLQLDNEKLKAEVKEIDQLQAKVKELEQRLYLRENTDYLDKPVLVHTIPLSEKNAGKSVNGITILGKELFVVTKCSSEMEVYDSKTFQHQRNIEIRGMANPLDIASSKDANCLYIVSGLHGKPEIGILSLEPTGKYLHQWSTGGGKGRLSTYGSNVILCISDKQLINEYTLEGELIVTVRLSPAAKLNNPLHAIKVTSTHFVVSHGDFKDELHRVCVVDLEGQIIKESMKWEKPKETSLTKMKVPICLLEESEGSIIVADTDDNRILVLSSMLKYKRKLIDKDNGLKGSPARLCFDDTQSRLFVAVNKWSDSKKEWKDGRICDIDPSTASIHQVLLLSQNFNTPSLFNTLYSNRNSLSLGVDSNISFINRRSSPRQSFFRVPSLSLQPSSRHVGSGQQTDESLTPLQLPSVITRGGQQQKDRQHDDPHEEWSRGGGIIGPRARR